MYVAMTYPVVYRRQPHRGGEGNVLRNVETRSKFQNAFIQPKTISKCKKTLSKIATALLVSGKGKRFPILQRHCKLKNGFPKFRKR